MVLLVTCFCLHYGSASDLYFSTLVILFLFLFVYLFFPQMIMEMICFVRSMIVQIMNTFLFPGTMKTSCHYALFFLFCSSNKYAKDLFFHCIFMLINYFVVLRLAGSRLLYSDVMR